jgi:hypothetical protein
MMYTWGQVIRKKYEKKYFVCILKINEERSRIRSSIRQRYGSGSAPKCHGSPTLLSRLCPETSTKFYVHEFGFGLLVLYTSTPWYIGRCCPSGMDTGPLCSPARLPGARRPYFNIDDQPSVSEWLHVVGFGKGKSSPRVQVVHGAHASCSLHASWADKTKGRSQMVRCDNNKKIYTKKTGTLEGTEHLRTQL